MKIGLRLIIMMLAPIVGYFSIVVLPDYLPLELGKVGLGIFFIFGVIFGYFDSKLWFLYAVLLDLWIEVESVLGIIFNMESHNLWPIELVFGVVVFAFGLAGTYIGQSLSKGYQRTK